MTHRRLLQELDSRELQEWQVWYQMKYDDEKEAQQRAQLEARARQGAERPRRRR